MARKMTKTVLVLGSNERSGPFLTMESGPYPGMRIERGTFALHVVDGCLGQVLDVEPTFGGAVRIRVEWQSDPFGLLLTQAHAPCRGCYTPAPLYRPEVLRCFGARRSALTAQRATLRRMERQPLGLRAATERDYAATVVVR